MGGFQACLSITNSAYQSKVYRKGPPEHLRGHNLDKIHPEMKNYNFPKSMEYSVKNQVHSQRLGLFREKIWENSQKVFKRKIVTKV